jgi:hypothetical protein
MLDDPHVQRAFAGGGAAKCKGVKVESNQHKDITVLLAVTAASAMVAVAALEVALGQERAPTMMGGGMSTGQTNTPTVAPTTLATSIVSPTMKAPRPKGF